MGRCYLHTDYEKYLCQISVLLITNLIGVQPKLSVLFDELLSDELKAATEKVALLVYTWLKETYIFIFYYLPLDHHYSPITPLHIKRWHWTFSSILNIFIPNVTETNDCMFSVKVLLMFHYNLVFQYK